MLRGLKFEQNRWAQSKQLEQTSLKNNTCVCQTRCFNVCFVWDVHGDMVSPIIHLSNHLGIFEFHEYGNREDLRGVCGSSEGPRPHFSASANREKMLTQQKSDTDSPFHQVYLLQTHFSTEVTKL